LRAIVIRQDEGCASGIINQKAEKQGAASQSATARPYTHCKKANTTTFNSIHRQKRQKGIDDRLLRRLSFLACQQRSSEHEAGFIFGPYR